MNALAVLSLVVLSFFAPTSIQPATASTSATIWPMFHQNAQHTGLSPFLGPSVPFLRWKFQTGGPIDSSPVVGHGRIYFTSEDGNLYAVNQQGVLLWKFSTNLTENSHCSEHGPFGICSPTTPAIGSDGTIYVAGTVRSTFYGESQGVLYALNPAGKLKWSLNAPVEEGGAGFWSPALGPDGTIYLTDFDFQILAVRPDGTVKWDIFTAGEVLGSPAVGSDGTVYVGVDDPPPTTPCQNGVLNKCLVAINPDGTIKWGLQFYGGDSPAIGADGTIYSDGSAISSDGEVKWSRSFFSPSIGPTGTILGPGDGGVEAYSPDGTLLWSFPVNTESSVAIGSDGVLYFGTGTSYYTTGGNGTGSVSALRPDGTLAWTFQLSSSSCQIGYCSIYMSDPTIGSGETLYIGSTDGNLYAIG